MGSIEWIGRGMPVARSHGGHSPPGLENRVPSRKRAIDLSVAAVRHFDPLDAVNDVVLPPTPEAFRRRVID
jgi:hypothetical protein